MLLSVLRHPLFACAVRLVLAMMFLVAGVIKLGAPEPFAVTIRDFGLLPSALALPAAWFLASLEVVVGVLLLANRRPGLELATVLTVIFIAVVSWGLYLGLDIDCGCYGPGDPEATAYGDLWTTLWRDLGMLLLAGFLFWRRRLSALRGSDASRVSSSLLTQS